MHHGCNADATRMQHGCNTDATRMQHGCNTDATRMQHGCDASLILFSCVYRKFHSGWTRRTDGISSRPDEGSAQADSRRPAFALQVESKAGSRNPDPADRKSTRL